MTKSFSNFTQSTSNKTKKKTVKNDTDNVDKQLENADKLVDDLSIEDFQKVLEQVTDYTMRENEKSPLVQKLNQKYAKEDNCVEAAMMFDNNHQTVKNQQTSTNDQIASNLLSNNNLISNDSSSSNHHESHLQKLENFCEKFGSSNCTSALTSSIDSNNQINGLNENTLTFKTNESSFYSSSTTATNQQTPTQQQHDLNSSDSSQQFLIHNHSQLNDNNSKCCDNLNCESNRRRSRLPFNVSNNVSKIEMKDYSKKAQIVEYTSSLTLNKPSDQANQLKIDFVNTQFAENCLNELNDTNRNYSSDCLNRYQSNLDDKQSHKTLSSSTSDGHISNTYFDNDNRSSSYHLNSAYLKKGSTSSSIQTNGKSEINNYLKKRKKPENAKPKLTQDCEGYVGYRDIQFLTNYVTGNDKTESSMRDQSSISKEMNVKKKEMNGKKKNGKESNETSTYNNVNNNDRSNQATSDPLTNDKNNNLSSSTNIIPTTSSTTTTNHPQQSSTSSSAINQRKESTDLSISSNNSSNKSVATNSSSNSTTTSSVVVGNSSSDNNHLNNQANKQQFNNNNNNNNKQIDKKSKVTSSSFRKSSAANLDLNNDRKHSTTKQPTSPNTMKTTMSNGLSNDIDCIQSDPEDKESGFKTVNKQSLRRKKQKGKNGIESSNVESNNSQNNSSTKPNDLNKKDSSNNKQNPLNPATARGYESESDYCAVEGRKKGVLQFKRDSLLDKKTNKKKCSISNSDSDSSNEETNQNRPSNNNHQHQETIITSFVNPLPPSIMSNSLVSNSKVSYAEIAKMSHLNATTNGLLNYNNNNNISNINNSTSSTVTTIQESATVQSNKTKENSSSKSNNKNRNSNYNNDKQTPKSNSKSINLSETIKSNNNNKDDKRTAIATTTQIELTTTSESQGKRQQMNKINNNDLKETTAELSNNDSSSALSSSSKSTSFNNSSNQPPVIMFDLNKITDQNTQFTFGFFDENAQLHNNVEELVEQFSSINIDSVNFISKDHSAITGNTIQQKQQQSLPNQPQPTDNNSNQEDNNSNYETKTDEIKKEITGKSIDITTILNSPINSAIQSNSSSSTLNSANGAPIAEGTYIHSLECEEENNSNIVLDNLTKKVQDKFSFYDSKRKPANEITSSCHDFKSNLDKFKEKITSPIDYQLQQPKFTKPNRPTEVFTKSVAYVQVVNYIRKAWEATHHTKPTYLRHEGPVNWPRLSSTFETLRNNKSVNVQVCN